MRRTVRTTWGLAAAAALAAGTLGMQATTAGSQAARPQTTDRTDAAALRALVAHPAVALTARGQHFVVTGRVVDPDGTTHVRLERTYHRLLVLGGDLVVHRAADGDWRGVSQTLPQPVRVGTRPADRADRARSVALAPTKATRTITTSGQPGSPRSSWTPPAAPRVSRGRCSRRPPRRRHAQPAGDLRRRPHRRGDPARRGHRDRRRLRPVPLRRHRPAAADAVGRRRTSSRTRRAAAPTRPT